MNLAKRSQTFPLLVASGSGAEILTSKEPSSKIRESYVTVVCGSLSFKY